MKTRDKIRYFFGVLFIISGITEAFRKLTINNIITAILFILFGLSLLPIVYKKIKGLKNKKLEIILPIVIFFIMPFSLNSSEENKNINKGIIKSNFNQKVNEVNVDNIEGKIIGSKDKILNEQVVNIENKIDEKLEQEKIKENENNDNIKQVNKFDIKNIPEYSNSPYYVVNNNIPFFNAKDLDSKSFERYSFLDSKKRCGVAYACLGKETMPTEKRGDIGSVKPSGWHTVKYEGIDGNYLYNRCHLIGYQLSAENANEKNLITGTRYLNIKGMLPFENMVADYIKETNNHVLYRVTPIFENDNLIASGILMEAKSVEDNGKGIEYNVYCYNVQPGIKINYLTGESSGPEYKGNTGTKETIVENKKEEIKESTKESPKKTEQVIIKEESKSNTYILNENSKKIHRPNCVSVKRMKESNKKVYTGKKEDLIAMGYSICKICNP